MARVCARARRTSDTQAFPQATLFVVPKSTITETETYPPFRSPPCKSARSITLDQPREERTKINLLGPETAGWGGGLPHEGAGVAKFIPSLEDRGREPGMSWDFCRDVLEPWRVFKKLVP